MASLTDFPAVSSITAALTRVGEAISNWCAATMLARSRSDQIEALQALSDQELAERGLTRDKIVLYVFRDQLAF